MDGEPIRRAVGRPRVGRDPFEVLWELRESAMDLLGGELPDDTYPDVRYVLVGGGAVLLHGYSRVTANLDILVEANEENAQRLLTALATWGEGAGAELTVQELSSPVLFVSPRTLPWTYSR